MTILLENVTTTTTVSMKSRPFPSQIAPTFVVEIAGGAATVNLYQSNHRDESFPVGAIIERGVYEGAGVCTFIGADVSEISGGAVVTVTVADN